MPEAAASVSPLSCVCPAPQAIEVPRVDDPGVRLVAATVAGHDLAAVEDDDLRIADQHLYARLHQRVRHAVADGVHIDEAVDRDLPCSPVAAAPAAGWRQRSQCCPLFALESLARLLAGGAVDPLVGLDHPPSPGAAPARAKLVKLSAASALRFT